MNDIHADVKACRSLGRLLVRDRATATEPVVFAMRRPAMDANENKRLLQDIFDRTAERDGSLFAASLAEEVTWLVTGQNAWSGLFRGKQEVLGKLQAHFRSLMAERPRTVPLRIFADGDHVIVEAKGDNVTKVGVRYDQDYCMVFRLEGGRIVEIREYACSALVERALGVFPAELAPDV